MDAKTVGWIRGAITGADNETIDPTMLCVVFAVFVVLPLTIMALTALAGLDVWLNKTALNAAGLGGGIAAILVGVASMIGTCAALLMQDRKTP